MTDREISVLRKIYDVLVFHERSFYQNYPRSPLMSELDLIIKQEEKRREIQGK